MARKYKFDDIKKWLMETYNYKCLSDEYKSVSDKVVCMDNEGYLLLCDIHKMMSRNQKAQKVHTNNPYSIYNINLYLEKYANGEFKCISNEYFKNNEELEFLHLKCNRIVKNKWINIARSRCLNNLGTNKTGLFCSHCNAIQLESTHALVLKQVWLHEEPDTIVEDRSCINPNTNCSLPTDIVNHRLKIAIEIQSWFHDFEDQQLKDRIKKEYWINKGYHFYAVDQRDYTVLEMVNLFFKDIKEIPDYVDFEYSNKFNDVEAQRLLDKYLSVIKVAEIMNCKPHVIYDAIYSKRLEYPKDYTINCYTPVVQLDLDKNYINEYQSMAQAEKACGVKGISKALSAKRNYCGGYYWVNANDYHSNNYTITPTRLKRNS